MTTLLIVFGIALAIAGVVVFPVTAHALLEALPPRSLKRLLASLVAVVVNIGTTAGGIALMCLAAL